MKESFQELFNISKTEGQGLTFFIRGHVIPALFIKLIDDEAVEISNQMYDRMIIRLDCIDALALN